MDKTHLFPFTYHEGMQLSYHEPKKKLFIDIKLMFERNQLQPEDTAILHMLQKYCYMNAYLIRMILNQQMQECTQNYCSKHLKKLEELGLVKRFQFIYTIGGNKRGTPFVYELTAKAKKLFRVKENSFDQDNLDINKILSLLSFNQFHIMFEKQMSTSLLHSSYHFDSYSDGMYKFMSNGKPVIFYLFTIRSHVGWKEKFLERLRKLKAHIEQNMMTYSGIIVVCENEMQSLAAERYRMSDETLRTADIYYMCDYAAVTEGYILQYLINVLPDNNYSTYNILKVPVDGNIFINVSTEDVKND